MILMGLIWFNDVLIITFQMHLADLNSTSPHCRQGMMSCPCLQPFGSIMCKETEHMTFALQCLGFLL